MRSRWVLCALLGVVATAYGKDPKPYQSAKLMQMNSVNCGTDEKSSRSPLGDLIGTDNGSRKSQEVLCQEYVLQADSVVYHIRPRDTKHPELLPVGSQAEFRLAKDKLLMHIDGARKDREYIVVSMTPRSDETTAVAAPPSQQ